MWRGCIKPPEAQDEREGPCVLVTGPQERPSASLLSFPWQPWSKLKPPPSPMSTAASSATLCSSCSRQTASPEPNLLPVKPGLLTSSHFGKALPVSQNLTLLLSLEWLYQSVHSRMVRQLTYEQLTPSLKFPPGHSQISRPSSAASGAPHIRGI